MKKIYIQPTATRLDMLTQGLIATSLGIGGQSNTSDEEVDAGDSFTRRQNFSSADWDNSSEE